AVEMNKRAFGWGRLAALDRARVEQAAGLRQTASADVAALPLDDRRLSRSLEDVIERRMKFLTGYQNARYAARYRALVDQARAAEQQRAPGRSGLAEAVARHAFKLMAYKDEYEVARLYTSGEFERQIRETFGGDFKLRFHLAPPLLAKTDADGHLRKAEYGPWVFPAFKLLAGLRFLRGTPLDVFGRTAERRLERRLIEDYFDCVEELLAHLDADNHALAVTIASIPDAIRGYGHVKEDRYARARKRWDELLAQWRRPRGESARAA
ncbi:MAG TPA: DUF6537 domain-containing protein, partial [Mizugakiibacter sp.]